MQAGMIKIRDLSSSLLHLRAIQNGMVRSRGVQVRMDYEMRCDH